MFYAIHETGRVVFDFYTSGRLVNLSINMFMIALGFGLRSPWPLLYPIGAQLNSLVQSANGGLMPVFGQEPVAGHIAANADSRYVWLSDWIYFWGNASSVGDVLIVVGLCATLWIVSRRVFTSPP